MTENELKTLAKECVEDHIKNGKSYGCVGDPESYNATEFAQFWIDGVAGDECRDEGTDIEVMRLALIEAWNAHR